MNNVFDRCKYALRATFVRLKGDEALHEVGAGDEREFYAENCAASLGHVEGYIKLLFKDMKMYDKRQDHEENLFHKLYEGLIGGVAKLLENTPRDEVATRTDVSGPLQNPTPAPGRPSRFALVRQTPLVQDPRLKWQHNLNKIN